tara:strand:- start:1513 stop:2439 length:927 start_codon:yes stop_codon:yes gene_type:complete
MKRIKKAATKKHKKLFGSSPIKKGVRIKRREKSFSGKKFLSKLDDGGKVLLDQVNVKDKDESTTLKPKKVTSVTNNNNVEKLERRNYNIDASTDPRQEEVRGRILRPSEREVRKPNMDDRKLAKIQRREAERAEKNRKREEERMLRMSDREQRKHARQQARAERKMERQQMRRSRKEQRQYRRTMRRKAREERREARGMTYTGGRRISPRRWTKNLLDRMGRRYVGEGRLKGYRDFRTSNMNPAYFETESGAPLSRKTRKGRVRSGEGVFDPLRGSVTRYMGGGMTPQEERAKAALKNARFEKRNRKV